MIIKHCKSNSMNRISSFQLPAIKQSLSRDELNLRIEQSLSDMKTQKTVRIKSYLDHIDSLDDYKKDHGFESIVAKIQERRRFSRSDKDVKRDSYVLFQKMTKKQ